MKEYKEVSVRIRWLKPQDIVTESGGLWFGLFLNKNNGPKIEDWGLNSWDDHWTEAK